MIVINENFRLDSIQSKSRYTWLDSIGWQSWFIPFISIIDLRFSIIGEINSSSSTCASFVINSSSFDYLFIRTKKIIFISTYRLIQRREHQEEKKRLFCICFISFSFVRTCCILNLLGVVFCFWRRMQWFPLSFPLLFSVYIILNLFHCFPPKTIYLFDYAKSI